MTGMKVETDLLQYHRRESDGTMCDTSDNTCRDLQTYVVIFIGHVIMCLTSH